jgi:hypothetical protein
MKPTGNEAASPEIPIETLARQLGQNTFEKTMEQVREVTGWEKLRRDKFNRAEIASLRIRGDSLLRRRTELLAILRLAPPSGDATGLLRKRWYYRVFALTLVAAGVFFAHLALDPFGWGWETWILCLGIGWTVAFSTEQTLEKIDSEKLIQVVCVLALLASLSGIVVLALLRGDILALYLKTAVSAETVNELQDPGSAGDFYTRAIPMLKLLMALLSVGMELGCGIAMFEAGKLDLAAYERAKEARKELDDVEGEMGDIVERATYLENDPVMNEAGFYREFCLGMLERISRNGFFTSLVIFGCTLWLFLGPFASAQAVVNTSPGATNETSAVIALDFTQSVAGKGYDGKTEFEKNVEAACHLIAQLPPGTRFTVLGITDRSFSQPYLLLKRELPHDKGPLKFQDRIAIAKVQAASELRRLAVSSPHSIPHTDIFGALVVGADILSQAPGRKVLILFTDMRQSTNELDFERATTISQTQALATVERRGLLARLRGVEVYALGVDGAGKSVAYWNSLRDFWEAYFRKAGANLKDYSTLRDSSVVNRE